jgi:CHASE2 domain-containing sensor protein
MLAPFKKAWKRIVGSKFVQPFKKPSVIIVFVLVALWNVLISYGDLLERDLGPEHPFWDAVFATARDVRNVNLHLQMRLYQAITWRAIRLKNENVRIVYIDDDTHWGDMYGNVPTDRKQIAKLIMHAAQSKTKASVIGVDIELFTPLNANGDDPRRTEKPAAAAANTLKKTKSRSKHPEPVPDMTIPPEGCMSQTGFKPGASPLSEEYVLDCGTPDLSGFSDNEALSRAVQFATDNSVTVVLGSYLYHESGEKESAPWHQLENLYSLSDLKASNCIGPRCTGYGFINLPVDSRQVPLVEALAGAGGVEASDSFAYKIAKAFKNSDSILDTPGDARPGKEVYGTFLREDDFIRNRIDYHELANATRKARLACLGKVVLIGGHWRGELGHGEPVDQHLGPAGLISGVALHGTYIEALLARQISHEWWILWILVLDVALGLLIFRIFDWIEDRQGRANKRNVLPVLALLVGMLCPIPIAWLSISTFNFYVDFLLPVELYFLHILVEMLERWYHSRHQSTGHRQGAGSPA